MKKIQKILEKQAESKKKQSEKIQESTNLFKFITSINENAKMDFADFGSGDDIEDTADGEPSDMGEMPLLADLDMDVETDRKELIADAIRAAIDEVSMDGDELDPDALVSKLMNKFFGDEEMTDSSDDTSSEMDEMEDDGHGDLESDDMDSNDLAFDDLEENTKMRSKSNLKESQRNSPSLMQFIRELKSHPQVKKLVNVHGMSDGMTAFVRLNDGNALELEVRPAQYANNHQDIRKANKSI